MQEANFIKQRCAFCGTFRGNSVAFVREISVAAPLSPKNSFGVLRQDDRRPIVKVDAWKKSRGLRFCASGDFLACRRWSGGGRRFCETRVDNRLALSRVEGESFYLFTGDFEPSPATSLCLVRGDLCISP